MISIYGALIPMQVLGPFRASLKDGRKLPIRYMVPSLRGGEFLAEGYHRVLLM